jgi:Protein of unknown function (DUF2911)
MGHPRVSYCAPAAVTLLLLMHSTGALSQPQLPTPQPSPAAAISQTIGVSTIRVTYHRPGVHGREIWGGLVPYGEVWRAGANENTAIEFTDPVRVQGQPLSAGAYGLHMIPTDTTWTVIFSKNSTSWGSFSYDQKEDALRVIVRPISSTFTEWLCYSVDDLRDDSAVVSLHWANLRVPIGMAFDVRNITMEKIRNEYLRGLARFSWTGWHQAANFCLQNDVHLDEGLAWVDRSIAINRNFSNLWVKSELLARVNRTAEAQTFRDNALSIATEADLNNLGYQYLQSGNVKRAIEVFRLNVNAHPDSWNVYDSLGEAYERQGAKKMSIENYQKALTMVSDENQRERIVRTLSRLGAR